MGHKVRYCHLDHLLESSVELLSEQEQVDVPVPKHMETPTMPCVNGTPKNINVNPGNVNTDQGQAGNQQGVSQPAEPRTVDEPLPTTHKTPMTITQEVRRYPERIRKKPERLDL